PPSLCLAAPPPPTHPLSLHDALPIYNPRSSTWSRARRARGSHPSRPPQGAHAPSRQTPRPDRQPRGDRRRTRCDEGRRSSCEPEIGRAHVELQSRENLVCRLLLEKKK